MHCLGGDEATKGIHVIDLISLLLWSWREQDQQATTTSTLQTIRPVEDNGRESKKKRKEKNRKRHQEHTCEVLGWV
jgi:hypothetical protein